MSYKLPDDVLSAPLGEPSVVCDLCDHATPVWDHIAALEQQLAEARDQRDEGALRLAKLLADHERMERERNEARAQVAALRAALDGLARNTITVTAGGSAALAVARQALAATSEAPLQAVRQVQASLKAVLDWGGWERCGCGHCNGCKHIKPALAQLAEQFGEGESDG
jgi:hypothetical protein